MNFRIALILVVVAVLLGGYLVFEGQNNRDYGPLPPVPFIVEDPEINRLDVTYFGTGATLIRDSERVWHYGDLNGPPVSEEFAGTPLLADGERSFRLIVEKPDDAVLALYGLDKSQITLRLHKVNGENYTVSVGDLTPDRFLYYAQIDGSDRVYVLDRTWDEHMARLIAETSDFVGTPPPNPTSNPTRTL